MWRIILLGKRRITNQLYCMDLIINDFNKSWLWGVRESVDGYSYLKHLIELWPEDCVEQLSKMNEEVDEIN